MCSGLTHVTETPPSLAQKINVGLHFKAIHYIPGKAEGGEGSPQELFGDGQVMKDTYCGKKPMSLVY